MSFLGMDLEAALKHARTLETDAANQVFTVLANMSGLVQELPAVWKGEDADHFQQQWLQHEQSLRNLHNALTDIVSSLTRSIAQQQETSS